MNEPEGTDWLSPGLDQEQTTFGGAESFRASEHGSIGRASINSQNLGLAAAIAEADVSYGDTPLFAPDALPDAHITPGKGFGLPPQPSGSLGFQTPKEQQGGPTYLTQMYSPPVTTTQDSERFGSQTNIPSNSSSPHVQLGQPQSTSLVQSHVETQTQDGARESGMSEEKLESSYNSQFRHQGWLHKLIGKTPTDVKWKKYWCYLSGDRLYYRTEKPEDDATGQLKDTRRGIKDKDTIRFIPLDRLPVRPLPHRKVKLKPGIMTEPDLGIAMVDPKLLGTNTHTPTYIKKGCTFGIVSGAHTFFLAAESPLEARVWVRVLRETWNHCFEHTLRAPAGTETMDDLRAFMKAAGENEDLKVDIADLKWKSLQGDSEWWRKWLEERAKNQILTSKAAKTKVYLVEVQTGNAKGAGTDARVYVEMLNEGAGLASGEVQLTDRVKGQGKPFRRARLDLFTVTCLGVGEPSHVRVWHDNTGRYPDWLLHQIRVRRLESHIWVTFPCKRWLSTHVGDKRISRLLLAGSGGPGVKYKVETLTSDIRGAGTHGHVYIMMHGEEGDGERLFLSSGHDNFERGKQDEFIVEDADLGELLEVTVGLEERGDGECWHLDHIIITNLASERRFLFQCRLWIGAVKGDRSMARRLKASAELDKKVWYTVKVTTGPARNAGTDADVYVALHGEYGVTPLHTLPSGPEHFERGQTDTFRVELPFVGKLHALTIGHNNMGPSPDWFLDFAEVLDEESGEVTLFPASCWIADEPPDIQLEVTLEASTDDPRAKVTEYALEFHTSSIRGAGTDSSVFFQLCGDQSDSEVQQIIAPQDAFERGAQNTFRFKFPYLGTLQCLRLQLDNTGANPAWHLVKVVVTSNRDAQPVTFFCNQWLKSEDPEVYPAIELLPNMPTPGTRHYKFVVKTSEERGSGTTSNVFVELRGSWGTTGALHLDSALAFQKGQEDTFVVEGIDVGDVEELGVSIDHTGLQATWKAEWLEMYKDPTITDPEAALFFAVHEWFNEEKGLVRYIQPMRRSQDVMLIQVPYIVRVYTSDLKGSSTDSNVEVNIMGSNGETGFVPLLANYDTFERGQEDIFTLLLSDVGQLEMLQVRSDGSSRKPNWHLDYVCIEKPDHPLAYFLANMWLDPTNGLEVQIPVSWVDPRSDRAQYKVTTVTSDVKHAGTDAGITVEIIGERTTSRPQQLVDLSKDTFERGETDMFPITCRELGEVRALRVTHDNKGMPWHMELAIVEAADGAKYFFPYNNWLGGTNSWTEISAVQQDPRLLFKLYRVRTHTSDVKGAGTDSRAYIEMRGTLGSSGKQWLKNKALNPFERGQADDFDIKCSDLGQLAEVLIGHDGSGTTPIWHLDLVEVVDTTTKQKWFFECNDWLGKAAGTLERLLKVSSQDPRTLRTYYRIITHTSNLPGAGTDANVYVVLSGAEGTTGPHTLHSTLTKDPFEKGQVDEFKIGPVRSLGQLKELTIGHDNTGKEAGWHLAHLEVIDFSTQQSWFFICNQWLDQNLADGLLQRTLPATAADPRSLNVDYLVVTHTSDLRGAGTDANVFIVIYGEDGSETGRLKLDKPGNPFERNQVDEFRLSGVRDVGKVVKIRVGHDDTGPGPAWHLKQLELTNLRTGMKYVFYVNKWFGKSEDDGQVEREIFPGGKPPADPANNSYDVQVITSDISGAGTDSNVFILLTGTKGEVGPSKLDNPKNNFERGQTDRFNVKGRDVGDLQRLQLWHDNSGLGSAWHCHLITIVNKADGKKWWFYCNQWLDKEHGLEKTLTASLTDPRLDMREYTVVVHTSDIKNAGTDANVFVDISGAKGSSGPQELKGHGNKFEKAQTDRFTLKLMDLGELLELEVWHDGSGFGSGWHLDYIEVTDPHTLKTFYFNCAQWLDSKEGDGKTRRKLIASDVNLESTRAKWRVTVHTGDVSGAGTDANVFIIIYGEIGDTGKKDLDKSGKNNFERNQFDSFEFTTPAIGPVVKVCIGHDNSGLGAAWYLDSVQVENLTTGENVLFQCGQWFDKHKGDKLIERELLPASSIQGGTNWKMVVVTANVSGAGTDAEVFIELHGDQGHFGPHTLQGEKSAFERAQQDTFSITTPELGIIQELTIGHNNKGLGAAWCLDRVELDNMSTGDKYVFDASKKWLDSKNGTSVKLSPSTVSLSASLKSDGVPSEGGEPVPQRLCNYKLDITNSSVPEGTLPFGDIILNIIGVKGETGRRITALPPDGMVEGKMGSITLPDAPDTGKLTHLEMGFTRAHQRWHVKKVLVTNMTTGEHAKFDAERLLDPNTPYLLVAKVPQICNYIIEVKTSELCMAGTSAAVSIKLAGSEERTDWLTLPAAGRARRPFRKGGLDVFELEGLLDVGLMESLEVKHDNTGFAPGWHLSWIRVFNRTTGTKAWFPCNAWLDTKEGDRHTSRTLYPEGAQQPPAASAMVAAQQSALSMQKMMRKMTGGQMAGQPGYKMVFCTSNVCRAGTNSRAFFELIGVNGSSGVVQVTAIPHSFARGARDEFTFMHLPFLGELQQLRVGTDGQGLWASWGLKEVEVTHIVTGSRWLFHCHGFLDRKCNFQRVLLGTKL